MGSAAVIPPLPDGFKLDAPQQGTIPPLPQGFTLDQTPGSISGRSGQPNSMQAAPGENTPEALARREAEHPVLTAVGKGSGEALGDVWNTVKGMVTHPVESAGGLVSAGNDVYLHIKQSIPIIQAYEGARSQGKGVIESLNEANEEARKQHEATDILKQRVDEFKKNPGQESVRAIANAATIAATMWDGGKLNPGSLPAATESAAVEAPAAAAATEAAPAAAKPGIVSKVTAPLQKSSVQPALQQSIRDAVGSVADEAGVAKPDAKSIGKVVENTADNVYAKSKGLYKVVDEATGGRVQRFSDRLKNIQRQLDNLTGTEEDIAKEESLLKARQQTEDAMQDAFADAKAKGVDPKVVDEASNAFKKSQALYDLNHNVRMARSGASPDIVDPKAAAKNPEIVDPEKFFKRIDQLHGSGRLQEALGDKGAEALYKKANDAVLQYRKVLLNQNRAKTALKYGEYAAGAGGAGLVVRQFTQ